MKPKESKMFIEFANKTIRLSAIAMLFKGSQPNAFDETKRYWAQISFDDPEVVECLKEYYPSEAMAQARYDELRGILLKESPMPPNKKVEVRKAWADPNHRGNSSKYHTGKPCIDCDNAAGTAWSPLWCFKCNKKRMEHINASMAKLINRDRSKASE